MRQELTRAIEKTARAVVEEIHTALPCEITHVDTKRGTVSVQPKGKYVTSDKKVLSYPVLTEVPVVFPYCQQSEVGIAFPIKRGDCCIVIISEVELDEWRSGARSEGPLRFDLSSAMAIPGLLNGETNLVSKAIKSNSVVIGSPKAEVSVGDNVEVNVGSTNFIVSERGIAIGGDLKVEGNISYTGTILKK